MREGSRRADVEPRHIYGGKAPDRQLLISGEYSGAAAGPQLERLSRHLQNGKSVPKVGEKRSYRLIALWSALGKGLERLIATRLVYVTQKQVGSSRGQRDPQMARGAL
jgi:hypothetical protein